MTIIWQLLCLAFVATTAASFYGMARALWVMR